ncbi:MAG: hypothetical protein ACD_2C00119G0011 [uncultured bacterium (gcode 4)]|uniref:Putative 3-methyladenine DNA glycosylase n=1 Tax=uncultured bacterium (gcode 4) TaxID=1234023 RepID=K2H1J6_9BACT|nr:MAG: hypothetical protein ACD_2C00119G0011 [uncultured bacterium (gcode 4)]
MILKDDFFNRDTLEVWYDLLGKKLIYIDKEWKRFSWIINETEAYKWSEDEASHAFRWITPRNRIMFETYGHVYVYFIYWMYHCMNFTTGRQWEAGAVLIRSIIPQEGISEMMANRKTDELKKLTDWPWKICQAFGIDKDVHGRKICLESDIFIEDVWYAPGKEIKSWSRIWIRRWTDKMWRFRFDN